MRDGLRVDEVQTVARALHNELADGKEPDLAYKLACRTVNGVLPVAFDNWKEEIFMIARGEQPPKVYPPGTTAFSRVAQLEADKAQLESDKASLLMENALLLKKVEQLNTEKAELEKSFLEDEPKKKK